MTSVDQEFPFDGDDFHLDIEALLRDFPEQLNRLKRLSGLSWSGLSRILGVDRKRCRRWADGTEPSGGSVLALFHLASRIPGGIDILLGLLTEPDLPEDEEEVEDQNHEHEQEEHEQEEHELEDDEA